MSDGDCSPPTFSGLRLTVRGVKRKLLSSLGAGETAPVFKQRAFARHILSGGHSPSSSSVRPCKGQAVYVYSEKEAWMQGVVTDVDSVKNTVAVHMDATDQIANCCISHVLLCPETCLEEYSNLTHIAPVHEASVLSCLQKRFLSGRYYTNAGTTVVAINPCTDVCHLYSQDRIMAYHSKQPEMEPHIYPVAEDAYTTMVRQLGKTNQSIIISGESGAGKTVSAKHLVKYLTIVSNPTDTARSSAARDKGVKIEQRILDSNPILEAFGNAATPRNKNSSRFGKFIELQFVRTGQIQGGAIQTYLLEKTRVMHQGLAENNFHVFYQMTGLKDDDPRYPDWVRDIHREMRENVFTCVPDNQDCIDNEDIMETLDAMTDIGLAEDKQQQIFQVLLAILYLGNFRFMQTSDDSSDFEMSFNSDRVLERSCLLLGLDPGHLRHKLLHRSLRAGGRSQRSVFVKPIGIVEARSRRDCLAMLLYSRLFEWLVSFINTQIKSESFSSIIGLLDIYGFEIFDANSLEQLCINYANERLQQHYVAHFLHTLQAEYTEECLQWVPVDYNDNRPCVEILDGRTSIFSVLNEEVYLNRKSDDEALKNRLLQLSAKSHNCLRSVRLSASYDHCFAIQHYAGEVQYSVSNMVTKNRDDIPSDLVSLLTTSQNHFVHYLFSAYTEPESPNGRKRKTVLTKFKSSLDELISSIIQSDIHYIRCLKPNRAGVSSTFELPYVLQQLRACGTIETVNICRKGYPARMLYREFQQRYSCILRSRHWNELRTAEDFEEGQKENLSAEHLEVLLCRKLDFSNSAHKTPTPKRKLRRRTGLTQHDHERKVCSLILGAVCEQPKGKGFVHQFGCTKLFLTETQLEQLESARLQALTQHAVTLQAAWRGCCCRRQYRLVLAARAIQTAWRAHLCHLHLKRHLAARRLQTAWRSHQWRLELRRAAAATRIQAALRMLHARRQYVATRQAVLVLQRATRQWLACVHRQRFTLDMVDAAFEAPSSLHSVPSLSSGIGSQTDTLLDTDLGRPSSPAMDGNWSDDSGVMVHEPVLPTRCPGMQGPGEGRGQKRDRQFKVPNQKRPRPDCAGRVQCLPPGLQGVHVGDGVVTWRRIPKMGVRFHTRASVLQYGHRLNRRELPNGLLDVLQNPEKSFDSWRAEGGSSVDP